MTSQRTAETARTDAAHDVKLARRCRLSVLRKLHGASIPNTFFSESNHSCERIVRNGYGTPPFFVITALLNTIEICLTLSTSSLLFPTMIEMISPA